MKTQVAVIASVLFMACGPMMVLRFLRAASWHVHLIARKWSVLVLYLCHDRDCTYSVAWLWCEKKFFRRLMVSASSAPQKLSESDPRDERGESCEKPGRVMEDLQLRSARAARVSR